jgi:hypothetical protein
MTYKKVCGASIFCLALIACSATNPDEKVMAAAQQVIAAQLKDPASAQFRNVRVKGETVCGEVNAKNSFGGYIGFKTFEVYRNADKRVGWRIHREPKPGAQVWEVDSDAITNNALIKSECDF